MVDGSDVVVVAFNKTLKIKYERGDKPVDKIAYKKQGNLAFTLNKKAKATFFRNQTIKNKRAEIKTFWKSCKPFSTEKFFIINRNLQVLFISNQVAES